MLKLTVRVSDLKNWLEDELSRVGRPDVSLENIFRQDDKIVAIFGPPESDDFEV